jgi:hypothetical protein
VSCPAVYTIFGYQMTFSRTYNRAYLLQPYLQLIYTNTPVSLPLCIRPILPAYYHPATALYAAAVLNTPTLYTGSGSQ